MIIFAVVALVVVAAIAVPLALVNRKGDSGPLATDQGLAAATEVTSPYDFSEVAGDGDPRDVERATYVSILLTDEAGKLTSYGINSSLPAAQGLVTAVGAADEVDAATLPTTGAGSGDGGGATVASALTFVFPDRSTLTYTLHLDQGLIARGTRAWKPAGDLQALVQAIVTAGPSQAPVAP
jgi:hypothetical protein